MTTAVHIALVTGGSRGLGRNMALRLAQKGTDVLLTYRTNQAEAEEVIREIRNMGRRAAAFPLDLSQPGSYGSFTEQVGLQLEAWGAAGLHALINNAGMGATVPFTEVTEAQFDEFLHVHFRGVFFLTQKLLPLIAEGGRIINISSGTTRFANPGYSVYASMKGAIEVFTKYLAKELGGRGIRANVVAPGPIETDFNSAAIRSNPQMKDRLSSLTPLGRVGTADDIGGVIVFLCSEEGNWINGQRIEVSGGIHS